MPIHNTSVIHNTGVPSGCGAQASASGTSRNDAAVKRCEIFGPAPPMPRMVTSRRPTGITTAGAQAGTPSASILPPVRSETTN